MKYLYYRWQSRLFIIMLISFSVSAALIGLELTNWAEQINQQGYSHGDSEGAKRAIPTVLMYILPFVKEIVLVGVPLLLTLLWLKIVRKLTSIKKRVQN